MTLVGALARREARAIRDNDLWGAWAAGDDQGVSVDSVTGARVTRNTALGLSAVWACVRIIADTIATLPVDTYTSDDDGVKRKYRPRPVWLDAPNPEQTPAAFWFGVVASLLLDGNAYLWTRRNRVGDVVEIYALDPQWMLVRREFQPDGSLALVYYVQVAKGQQSPVGPSRIIAGREYAGPFTGADMFHVTAFNPNSNWPLGLAPLEVARQMFGTGIANQEMAGRFYGQGMNASGVIEVPTTAGDFTIEQARQLKEDFSRANSGLRKMFLPPVLTGGAQWKQMSISPEQAQFLQAREFVVEDVARWFGVPLWMIQSTEKTTSWGSGVEQQGIAFATYTIGQWTEKIAQAFTRWTLRPFHPADYVWNLKKLLRGDHAGRAAYYASGRQWGYLSVNDVRIDEDLTPIGPDGDIYLQPVNMEPPSTSDPHSVPKTTLPSTSAPADGDGAPDEGAG